ncbi:ComEC/Rec2 family competence protein [Candidatus Bandiella numerosa]|uniref:ComEC/Rec2 family competence protein n=1 Tax=Candidatus Bandiella numerosa TaxID=2570586 RepID=UPI003015F4CA
MKIVVRTKLDAIKNKDKIIANVNLMPPPTPVLPGSFDYARYAFFNDISAIGYAMGNIKIIQRSDISKFTTIGKLREVISKCFYENMDVRNASIATALFLGNTKRIDTNTYDNIRISGIAHLLAISGMHVALVASIIFFASNIIFSKIYNPLIKINNKKISALITIFFSYLYLLIANAPISAQRAFTMTTLFLIGIVIDRETNPIRTIVFAAIVILLITPEALFSASLQMSFSASLSLIYGFKFLKKLSLFYFNYTTSKIAKLFGYFFFNYASKHICDIGNEHLHNVPF